ncbi:MAG TPA: DUF5808 domain-containing protein [Virgibacillus sp.]|nr:DUF5808 domain-containing protein [Virgibacillus sp.]
MSGLMFLLLTIIMVSLFLILMFTPYITRKTESFGVSIPELVYHDDRLKKMRQSYVFQTGILSGIALLIFLMLGLKYGGDEQFIGIVYGGIIVAYIIGSFLIYLVFHRQMTHIKRMASWKNEKTEHVVIDTTFHNQRNTYSNGWFLISVIMIGATLFITFLQYDRIPSQIPINYDFSGKVTRWADKSIKSVSLMPVMQLFMLALFVFINTAIGRAKQQISVENPKESAKQSRIFRRRWSLFLIISGTLLVILFGTIQLSFIYLIDDTMLMYASMGITGLTVVGSIILAFTTGQGGSRVKVAKGNNEDKIDRDDDRYWKLGQFYVNRRDPAVFLEKRFGVGWTANFAHPLTWLLIGGILAISIGLPLFLTL